MLKNKKIIFILMMVLIILIIGTIKVNAETKVNCLEDLANAFQNKVDINNNEIILNEDVVLEDCIVIYNGNYTIDLNGHKVVYDKNYATAFTMLGGNVVLKDSKGTGTFEAEELVIACYKGFIKIEGGEYITKNYAIAIVVNDDGILQIDDARVVSTGYECLSTATGTLIINGGVFEGGLQIDFVPFSEKIAKIRINGGEFIGIYDGIYSWTDYFARDTKLRGGNFKSSDPEGCGIYVKGNKFDLNNLLAEGYKFDSEIQNVSVKEYENGDIDYIQTSDKEVNVIKKNGNFNKTYTVIFVDDNGNLLETKEVCVDEEFEIPAAPEKEGYVFTSWSEDLINIEKDMVVKPNYEKINNLFLDVIYPKIYTGNEINPEIIVRDLETKEYLTEGVDYEVICENNIKVGTAKITITGIGKYKYSEIINSEFRITPKYLYNADLKLYMNEEYIYNGKEIKPEMKFVCDGVCLEEGKDFEVEYSNNKNAGYASITITGIGNYTGTAFAGFRILEKEILDENISVDLTDKIYTGNAIEPKVTIKVENKELIQGEDYSVYYSYNTEVGIARIIILGTGNYSGSFEKNFNIVKSIKDLNTLVLNIDTSNKECTGRGINTKVELKDSKYTLKEGLDYTVSYSNNSKVGKATVTITGKGDYKGTIVRNFNIVPKKSKITSLKNIIIRSVTLNWSKDSSVDGYEVYVATSENGNYSKVKTINSNWITTYLGVAQKKGTYFYKVRSFVCVNGTKVYGEFSDIQKVTVTK